MYANRNDPESLNYPHERLSTDADSSGLFQQRPPWWGTAADRMDPARSAGLFYEALQRLNYNDLANSPGRYAQQVQQSAYPGRYDQRMSEAQAIYDRLAEATTPDGGKATGAERAAADKPDYTEIERMGASRDVRSSPPTNFLLHTEEGDASAESLAAYLNNPDNGVSYHYTLRDEVLVDVVDTDYASWSVLAANAFSLNLCFAGTRAAWPRDQWMRRERDIEIAAYIAVQDCRKYGIPVEVIKPPYHQAPGISDHRYVTECLGIGNHTDVGDGFPWDVFEASVDKWAGKTSAADDHPIRREGTAVPAAAPPDPDAYPLRWDETVRECWGPLDGPDWCISNQCGTESQASKDGLARWQQELGLPGTGVYDGATKAAATRMQQLRHWPPHPEMGYGLVWMGEWDAVIRDGWRFPEQAPLPTLAPPSPSTRTIDPGPKVTRPKKIKDVTGPGHTDGFGIGGTDLGVMCRTPSGRILAVFGDTFRDPGVGGPEWRSPVGLFSDTTALDDGIEWSEACGDDPKYAGQLIDYSHDNGEFTTILPSDVITVGDKIYLHVMVNNGLQHVIRTELWRSDDDGRHWTNTGVRFPADLHHNLAQLITWDLHPNGWVYIMSTSFTRNDPLILRRVPHDQIENPDAYQGWGWADGGWNWASPPTPVLEDVTSGAKFGETSLRYIQGQWFLVNFDASTSDGSGIDVRVFADITENLYQTRKTTPIRGTAWGMEGDDAVAQLYGPSIIPGSTPDGGFHILLSQWNTAAANGWPYRVMQFKIPVDPAIPPDDLP
ncbi:DUF4185 domain-containing protein [Nocardia vaccinii]|uniref:DUF4185 domain-containing protein n=1 Tax=Nocardia vaccinii TaxID=1822 RepID=UPI001FDEDB78|nr:DUF4185 domain-containing protein [Nocardia vaccinii]